MASVFRSVAALLLLSLKLCEGWPANWTSISNEIVPYREIPAGGEAREPRIIGGERAEEGEVPYQVLVRGHTLDSSYLCGGSLLSPNYVLTAAHCLVSAVGVYVTVGSRRVEEGEGGGGGGGSRQSFLVRRSDVSIHEDFDPYNIKNDIALLKLPKRVDLTKRVEPVRLPKLSQKCPTAFDGKAARISGWGRTSDDSGVGSDELRYADVPVMEHALCRMSYVPLRYTIDDRQICSGFNGSGSCNGDSGGPMVVREADGRATQVGVVSFGSSRCQSKAPSVYTYTGAYLSWIYQVTGIQARR